MRKCTHTHEHNLLNRSVARPFRITHSRSQPVGEWYRPVGALPDIIEHERTGVIVKPGNVEGTCSAMGRLASLRLGLKQLTAEMCILHLTDEVVPIRGTTGTDVDPENRTG